MAKKDKIDTMMRFSPLQIPRIIRSHWRAKPKEPAHFVGEPSTVKSEMAFWEAQQLAIHEKREFLDWNRSTIEEKKDAMVNQEKYFVFADVRASETDIGELRLQDLKAGESFITFKYNLLFEVLRHKEAMGIIFFDEMNLAPNMIKAQFYKIINDRCIGDIPISENVLVMSAGNESDHARGVVEDPVPLVLRRGNYFIRPLSPEEYIDYAVKAGHHQWVTGYLGFAPHNLHKIDYDVPESTGQPCPRTWSKLSNVLANNQDLRDDDVEMHSVGFVGQGVGMEFAAYVRAAKKVDLDGVLKNPKLINEYVGERELSLAYAIISGVVEKFRNDRKVIKPAFEIALYISRVELGTYLLRCMKNLDETKFMKSGAKDVPDELVNKVVEKYAKFLFKQ
jgi:hypothetical protein